MNLWLQFQKELAPDCEVYYFSQKLRKAIVIPCHPTELMTTV